MRFTFIMLTALFFSLLQADADAQSGENKTRRGDRADRTSPSARGQRKLISTRGSSILRQPAWFGTLESARKEAARTDLPILLFVARPECRGVPGVW